MWCLPIPKDRIKFAGYYNNSLEIGILAVGHSLKSFIRALLLILAAAVSCTEKVPEDITPVPQESKVYLKISSVSTSELVRSAIEETSFPSAVSASIGLFIGETKNAVTTKPADSGTWSDPKITLEAAGDQTLYGYYPYAEGLTSVTSIPVRSSVDGDDWMWATPVGKISSARPEASLKMNHALALVEITFNVTDYAEGSEMTALSLAGTSFSQTGSLDATNGTVAAGTSAGSGCQLLAAGQSLTLKDGVIVAKCLLVPTGLDGRQDMTISCTLAGKSLKATLSGEKGVIVKPGLKSTVSLNIKGTAVEVVSSGIIGWEGTTNGSTATVNGHIVTVTGDVSVSLSQKTDIIAEGPSDASVSQILTIKYSPSAAGDSMHGILCTNTGTCKVAHDAATGTITVTDVTSDATISVTRQPKRIVTLSTDPSSIFSDYLTNTMNVAVYLSDRSGYNVEPYELTSSSASYYVLNGDTVTLRAAAAVTTSDSQIMYHKNWKDASGNEYSKNYQITPFGDMAFAAVYTDNPRDSF